MPPSALAHPTRPPLASAPARGPAPVDTARTAAQLVTVEITPGATITVPWHPARPAIVLCRLARSPGSPHYHLTPVTIEPHVRITRELPAQLGLGIGYKTLGRLVKAGLISGRMLTPQVVELSLHSLAEFLQLTQIRDGQTTYWTPERKAAFSQAHHPFNDGEGDDD